MSCASETTVTVNIGVGKTATCAKCGHAISKHTFTSYNGCDKSECDCKYCDCDG